MLKSLSLKKAAIRFRLPDFIISPFFRAYQVLFMNIFPDRLSIFLSQSADCLLMTFSSNFHGVIAHLMTPILLEKQLSTLWAELFSNFAGSKLFRLTLIKEGYRNLLWETT